MAKKQLLDVVYVLKSEINPEELRYSLRSVEENFPHRYVWFVGSMPEGFKPDKFIRHIQTGNCKWALIKSSLWKVIENEDITEDFFWFNDDFFVMKKQTGKFINFVDGTLERRIDELHRDEGMSAYTRSLYKAEQELMSMNYPTMNYDVHLPILVNKTLAEHSINKCSSPQFRSIYGNINEIPYVIHPDVKVYDTESVPEEYAYLSTHDRSFKEGKVGEYIRATFDKPSRFEV